MRFRFTGLIVVLLASLSAATCGGDETEADPKLLAAYVDPDGAVRIAGEPGRLDVLLIEDVAVEPWLAWSPDATHLAVVEGQRLHVFAVPSGETVANVALDGPLESVVAWRDDGSALALEARGAVHAFALDGAVLGSWPAEAASVLGWSHDGTQLAWWDNVPPEGQLSVARVEGGGGVLVAREAFGDAIRVDVSGSGWDDDGTLVVFDLAGPRAYRVSVDGEALVAVPINDPEAIAAEFLTYRGAAAGVETVERGGRTFLAVEGGGESLEVEVPVVTGGQLVPVAAFAVRD